jgi:hypothetical protein
MDYIDLVFCLKAIRCVCVLKGLFYFLSFVFISVVMFCQASYLLLGVVLCFLKEENWMP